MEEKKWRRGKRSRRKRRIGEKEAGGRQENPQQVTAADVAEELSVGGALEGTQQSKQGPLPRVGLPGYVTNL